MAKEIKYIIADNTIGGDDTEEYVQKHQWINEAYEQLEYVKWYGTKREYKDCSKCLKRLLKDNRFGEVDINGFLFIKCEE